MKKIVTTITMMYCLAASFNTKAQITENFDGATFSLTPNSYYKNTTVNDWQVSSLPSFATFRYHWDTAYGGLWGSGSAYTNVKDTSNGTYTNLYGSITNGAFNGNYYVASQNNAIIKMNSNALSLSGFFVTNTTFAYKTMKNGTTVARKFGDTTGTHSGLPQGTYPDWFKIIVRPYRGGVLLTDSVEHYLADYRAAGTVNDFIQKNWQYVFCANLPISDSILITLKSSDTGTVGINTPGFFCMDNISVVNTVGIYELENVMNISVFPNPTSENMSLQYIAKAEINLTIRVFDVFGKEVLSVQKQTELGSSSVALETSMLNAGIYFIEVKEGSSAKKIKFIKL